MSVICNVGGDKQNGLYCANREQRSLPCLNKKLTCLLRMVATPSKKWIYSRRNSTKIQHSTAAWLKRLKCRFYGDRDRVILVQLPPSSHTLLRPRIRRFKPIISAWWLRTSSK